MLRATASANARRFEGSDEWKDSPFSWLRDLPTTTRAKAAESIVMDLLQTLGYLVQPRLGPGHDRLVEGVRVKVKFSTRWASGSYTFQQVRDGSYDVLLLFGLSPTTGHLWVVPNTALAALTPSTTAWVSVDPAAVPESLQALGGPIESVIPCLYASFGSPSAPNATI